MFVFAYTVIKVQLLLVLINSQKIYRILASILDLIGASRSTTPASLGSRKSSTNDQGVQVSRTGKYEKKVVKPIQPPTQNPSPIKERQDSKTEEQEQVGWKLLFAISMQCIENMHIAIFWFIFIFLNTTIHNFCFQYLRQMYYWNVHIDIA